MKFAPALLACLFLNTAITGQAASVLWTNLAGGNWNAATNWSPNQVPAAADHAIITNAGTYTVLVDMTATIDSLTVGGTSGRQTLSNFVSTLTLNGAGLIGTNATFASAGGSTLAGNGDLSVAGRLEWTGGVMQGFGRTVIAPGATLAVSGSGYHKFLYRALDLRGTGTLSGGAWLYGGYGVPLNIFNGASFDIQGDTQMPWAGAGGVAVINNAGTLRKSAGARAPARARAPSGS